MAHLALFTVPHAMSLTSWLENLSSPTLMRAGQALLAQQAVSILACDAEQCQARVQDGQHSYRVTLAEQSTCECGTDNQGGCAHMALAATQCRRADRAAQSQQNRLTPGQRRALAHTSGTTLQRRTGAVAGHLAPDLSPAAQLDAAAESSVLSQRAARLAPLRMRGLSARAANPAASRVY